MNSCPTARPTDGSCVGTRHLNPSESFGIGAPVAVAYLDVTGTLTRYSGQCGQWAHVEIDDASMERVDETPSAYRQAWATAALVQWERIGTATIAVACSRVAFDNDGQG